MVISKGDRISAVLKEDESLVEVFAALSPAFERLRNPRMRRVMAQLVTVEQAARMAGVDADELVRRLNEGSAEALGPEPGTRPGESASARSVSAPAGLRDVTWERIVTVDVRAELRSGREPFSMIMAARRTVPPGGALCVRAIFEPVPLYAVMAQHGFDHHTEQLGDEDWQVWFYPLQTASRPPASVAGGTDRGGDDLQSPGDQLGGDDVVVLDVRDLEPPEPMMRTLAALENLPSGGTLVQINVRVPQFLLPRLEERGFTYEIRQQAPNLVRVFIRRATA
jgi:uncharacterized protein (DUF2249 family)